MKKIQNKENIIQYKIDKKIRLTKREKTFMEKLKKEREAQALKEAEEKNKIPEPTMEEKQLALLESINENLIKLNREKEKVTN